MGIDIKRVAVIGTGVIGASWTALFSGQGTGSDRDRRGAGRGRTPAPVL